MVAATYHAVVDYSASGVPEEGHGGEKASSRVTHWRQSGHARAQIEYVLDISSDEVAPVAVSLVSLVPTLHPDRYGD